MAQGRTSSGSIKDYKDLELESKIKLNLSGKDVIFENGEWKGEISTTDVTPVLQENEKLKKENNLLKIKIEVLLNMLAEFMFSRENS